MCAFEQHFCLYFYGSKGGCCVGGEEWIACTCREDDHSAFFQVSHGTAANIRFGDLGHLDGSLHSGGTMIKKTEKSD